LDSAIGLRLQSPDPRYRLALAVPLLQSYFYRAKMVAQKFHFAILRIEVTSASRGLSAIAELRVTTGDIRHNNAAYVDLKQPRAVKPGHRLNANLRFRGSWVRQNADEPLTAVNAELTKCFLSEHIIEAEDHRQLLDKVPRDLRPQTL